MPPTPPDRPIGAALPLRPKDDAVRIARRRSAGLPAVAPVRLTTGLAPGLAPFGPGTPSDRSATASPHGLAEAPAAFLHPADLARPRAFAPVFDPVAVPPDQNLIARYTARLCLRHGLLPWQVRDGETLILTASPAGFETHRTALAAAFGPAIRPLPCPRDRIEAALLAHASDALTEAAEYSLAPRHSARSLNHRAIAVAFALLFLALASGLALGADRALPVLFALAILSLYALFLLKAAACIATLRHGPALQPPPLPDDLLPIISVLIPLYGEAEIATRLLKRIARIDYPADRLDILILTEEDDTPTRLTLASAPLPQGVRVLAVPKGRVRTKPRALNFGLDFCRGNIIGIWDAEDAPAPDQLRKVAAAFDAAPPDLACLQGALDFYNPSTNWIARCFTMEYALWFRLFLPGLERLDLPMPLGGTTLFLRRDRIEAAGGWDAHNVTEDADLGLRLARMGLRIGTLDSTTMEEANCRIRPWIKQRSRWSKGYLMTWLVHMRAPVVLLRDLGLRRFLAVQALLLGSLITGMLGPLILLLWGYSLPFAALQSIPASLPDWVMLSLILIKIADFAFIHLAMRRTTHNAAAWWLLLMKPYALLGTIATVKAIGEAPLRPFHWDKTRHGQFHDPDPETEAAPQEAVTASLSRPPPPEAASQRPC
ncbi:glycosyltransferase family 2 protein [Fuscovulum ytuae]|uniref:Glycosyltransferase n=1 Tax=Fuscovulum ytuae TaxID=3042299 RepID=A0ABY8Q7M7_9RHOB|nr:glycosyltransferase [Fuscovulum sp. YMD61]WGV16287.1 glycosyltransferase [Fuscovulum sp. YMD61]